jgi:hypothetical protein
VRQAGSLPFEGIGKALHAHYDAIAMEPLPERWIAIVNLLNGKKDGNQTRASGLQPSRGFGGEVQPKTVFDAQYWLDRAEETRLLADQMTYPDLRREMLKVAAGYRRLAERALEQTARKKQHA